MKKCTKENCPISISIKKIEQEVKTRNTDFKNIIFKCMILLPLLFASLITEYAVWLTLIVSAVFICTEKSSRRVYYMIFLLPFLNILRYTSLMGKTPFGGDFYLSIFLWCLTLAILGVQLIIDLSRGKKKINIFFTIMTTLLAVYFALPFGAFDFTTFGAIYLTLAIIYVLYYYARDYDYKEIIFIFFIAVIFGALFGFFRPVFGRSINIIPFLPDSVTRFTGVSNDPNYFAGDILMILAGLMILYITKNVRYLFYPALLVLTVFGIMSASKMFFVTYAVLMAVFVIYLLVKNWNREGFFRVLTICITFVLACGISYRWILGIFFRVSFADIGIKNEAVITVPVPVDLTDSMGDDMVQKPTDGVDVEYIEKIVVFKNNSLTGLSTGRTNIWLWYLEASFDTPMHALFGNGIGAPFLYADNGANYRQRAEHNTFVQMMYRIGIVGMILVALAIISTIDRKKFKGIKIFNFANAFIIFMLFMSLCNMLSYRLSIYVLILSLSLVYIPQELQNAEFDKKKKIVKRLVKSGEK